MEEERNKKIDDAIRKKERLLDIEKERAGALSALLGAEETQEERLVSESILEQDEKAFREHFKRLSQIRGMQLFNQREQELKDVQDPTIINAIEERYRLLFAKLNNEISNAFRNGLRQVGTDLNKVDLTLKEVGTTLDQLAEGRSILLSLGFDFDSATDLLVEAGEESVKEFQKRQSSQGERNFFVDTFGVSEENLKAGIEAAQTALNTLGDVFSAQAEREIAVETNRTNQLNDQLKQRLANEQLSADERDKINQEIARNEAQLVAKENQINKKRFEQEKAVNIALATVNTFSAATGVLAETKGGTFARIAGMIAVIGAGLAQVAIIAKQQFTAKAMPSPNLSGLGGAGGGGAEPQFNVIGATGQNQLAAAIAATQQQPVKAYVVSNDVTTAQSLDRNIVAEASL
jgi:VIT1/CCC1 family predicted Fe2+/Mn2+ transporter